MKNLLIKCPIVSLVEPPSNKSLIILCLAIEDLYNEGAIGGDGLEYRMLCDFCIGLGASLECDDSLVLHLLPTNVSSCCQSHSVALEVRTIAL